MSDTPARTQLAALFADPPREFGIMPFWLWNDDLDDAEMLRQIGEFHAAGFGGFVPHARIGLSRRIGYLTPEYFRLIRLAVEEAARLGMKVILYDEGSYPSGSAAGAVVEADPAHAARCLIARDRTLDGPAVGYWRPSASRSMADRLIAVVAARELEGGTLDPATFRLLEPIERDRVRYDLPAGRWRLVSVWDVYSGGTIRGVFDEQDDGHALAPAAADLMNPDAVASFLRITHERYYEHLKEFFGTTVVAMFTDEPNPLGRGARRGPDAQAFSEGLLDEVASRWDGDPRLWLPALWHECGERTAAFRHAWRRSVDAMVERVFYGMQYRWCDEHGIALTGHPAGSDDLGSLRRFQWPGQDMVWRYVEPNAASALEGAHSTAAKVAASAGALREDCRVSAEVFGAYGWRLTLDEVKWLIDWHAVRGVNLFIPHAAFYSIRGRRAFESEPDIGNHNAWWRVFPLIANYARRLCWLLAEGEPVRRVAVLTDADGARWEAARELYRAQIDFVYVDAKDLAAAHIDGKELVVEPCRFEAVVCDPQGPVAGKAGRVLEEFAAAGGCVVETWEAGGVVDRFADAVTRDVVWPDASDVRVTCVALEGRTCFLLVNEGEEAVEGAVSLNADGAVEVWDPLDGSIQPWHSHTRGGRTEIGLRLERRQSLVAVVDPYGNRASTASIPSVPGAVVADVTGSWTAETLDGERIDVPCPGDWAATGASEDIAWEVFSGALRFTTEFVIDANGVGPAAFLDLGRVGDVAELRLNGTSLGARCWPPYVWPIGNALIDGTNLLEVLVTNSSANRFDGLQRPSGILGPVTVRAAK